MISEKVINNLMAHIMNFYLPKEKIEGGEGWSGLFGQETGIYKWETALGSGSCRSLFLR
jgi:hypothetical protein